MCLGGGFWYVVPSNLFFWYCTVRMPHKLPYKEYLRVKLARQAERQLLRLYPNDEARRAAFQEALVAGQSRLQALFWVGERPATNPFATRKVADWQPDWVDVLVDNYEQPSRNPLYHEGAFYPLDFSSVATVSAILTIQPPVRTVLDVCSAPGGKAIFSWRHLHPERLICNEVIGKRHASLHGNLDRCHIAAEVARLDPKQLPTRFEGEADLVMVDAPCSGQSLIARGLEAPGAFQDHLINANMKRQRRILAESIACVAPGGYLSYTTCTFSREENEKNVEWLLRRFPEFQAVEVPHLAPYRSTLLESPCYRIEPHQGIGAGGFVALLKRQG